MPNELKPGMRLRAGSSTAEFIVVRVPSAPVELAIDGVPLSDSAEPTAEATSDGPAIELGKRYVDEDAGVELLCARAGSGSLSCNGQAMTIRGAKPLPASD